jgi:hypothetical protein
MHERDLQAEHAAPGLCIDQLGAVLLEVAQDDADILDLVGDVVHAGASAGEELPDRRVVRERGEQLDPAPSDPDRRGLDALLLDARAMLEPTAEEALVRRHGLVEVEDCDPDVMDPARIHAAIVQAEPG